MDINLHNEIWMKIILITIAIFFTGIGLLCGFGLLVDWIITVWNK